MDEFDQITGNHTKVSGNQEEFLAFLDRLRASPDVELQKEVGGMGLDGVHGHEKFVGNLLVGEAFGHEFEDLVFSLTDAEFFKATRVELEIGDGNMDDFTAGEPEARPYADGGEDDGEHASIELERKVADEKAVLQEFEDEDDRREGETI